MGIEDLKKLMTEVQQYSENNIQVEAKEVVTLIRDRLAIHFEKDEEISKR
ncbi:hypothetical protein ACERII_18570 [Evansella sp. AB-rgal1]